MNDTLKFKTSIPLMLLFCIYLHPVMLKGPSILSYIYIYGIPAIYLILNISKYRILTIKQGILIGLAIILIVLSIVYPTLHNTNDYSYVKVATYIFRKLVVYIFLVSILAKHYKEKTTIDLFMYYFSLAQATYVVGTILLVFLPGIKKVWFSLFNEVIDSEEYLQAYGYTFRIGWQGFSGFGFTIFCSFSCLFLMYLYYNKNSKLSLTTTQFIVPFALCFLGNMFYGRSGLIVSIVGCLAALVVWNRKHFFKVLKIAVLIAVVIEVVYSLRDVAFFRDWYNWMSTPIINVVKTGHFNNASFQTTQDMIFKPEMKTIFLGDGYFMQDGHYYMKTDSGFMRNILFWGMLGLIISYGMTIYSLTELKKKDTLLFILFVGAFFAFEYKGHVYYDFAAIMLAFTFIDTIRQKYLVTGTVNLT